jgi:hypothetical protein
MATQDSQQQLLPSDTPPVTVSGKWVVHNSLLPKGGAGANDDDSVHSLHGAAANVAPRSPKSGGAMSVSQSAPNLDHLNGLSSPMGHRNMGRGEHARSVVNLSATQGIPFNDSMPAPGGTRLVSLNIPRAYSTMAAPAAAAAKNKKGGGKLVETHTEKLTKEVDLLATQLDESLRERDMQRIELSRLRKQLMSLSSLGAAANLSHSQVASINLSANNSMYYQSNPQQQVSLQLPSILSQQQPLSQPRSLTNADMYGVPSEQDKRDMRLAPSASVVSSDSSMRSKGSQQQQVIPQQQVISGHGGSKILTTGGANMGRNSNAGVIKFTMKFKLIKIYINFVSDHLHVSAQ